ncbi:uncharacterized protein [Physcomitrium patens]|uniref:uncharacterized protein isoform X2 n=1 Tax=Physcomitrium patens TaxID=3218 RepID=UPI000D17BAC5|nr:uncharacterized protein LOC112287457 isoform X2 [Physcomitrium patens]|eukprot:XP_024386227.1 uncharacterized protein LOC112287457 isoform X2 [Physcomitrella patens]
MTHISYSVASFSIMRVLTRCREGALYKNIQTTKATPWRLFLNSYVLKSRTVRFQVVRFLRTQTHESLTLMFRLHKETLDMLFAEILCYSLGDQESWQLRRCAHQMERVASNNVTNTIPSQHSGFYFIFTPDAAFGPHCSAPAPVHQLKLIWTSSGVLILRSHSAKRHSFSYSGGGLTRSSLISG